MWIDGSQEQLEKLRSEACATGEMIKLNQEKLPGCYYYRTDAKDVARDEKGLSYVQHMKKMQVLQTTGYRKTKCMPG